jgi:hypothetical protein
MKTPTKKSEDIYGMGFWINNDNPIKHYYFWDFRDNTSS